MAVAMEVCHDPTPDRRRLMAVGLMTIVALGGMIRVWPALQRPLWFDEADTWRASCHLSYDRFFTWTNHFETAPLTFLCARVSTDVFGTTAPWALRVPALAFGILCIPAMFVLGSIAHSRAVGLVGATLMAFDPNMVDQSQQCRMYSLLVLLTIIVLAWSISLMRKPDRGFHGMWHWAGLGITLGLLLCTTQLAVAVWVGLAVGAVGWLAWGWFARQPRRDWPSVVSGLTLAFVVGILLANVGVYRLLYRVVAGGPGDGSHLSLGQIGREILVAAKDLIHLGPVGLLVYAMAVWGLVQLSKRHHASTAILVGVAAVSVLILFPFRKMHHFMDARYLSLAQPTLFVGLALCMVGWSTKRVQIAAAVIVLGYAGIQAWQCVKIERWWQQPDKYLVAPRIIDIRDRRAATDAVVYHPQVLDILGKYYDLPPTPRLGADLYEDYHMKSNPRVSEQFDAPVTWLLVGMVNWDARIESARTTINALASHYGVVVDPDRLSRHLRLNRVLVARFSNRDLVIESVSAED